MIDQNIWEVVIGLEVHAQVISQTKLFSASSTKFGAEANKNTSFIDAAFPGVLPVLNSFCVDQAIKTGLGINATINKYSTFDRKNYFYPDLPSGYQITQFFNPIVSNGYIDISNRRVRIERIHLEQDAGKSIHANGYTMVDLNRAGIALMEIVTHPDMRSASEAAEFLRRLRAILRALQTCDGNMEEGSIRADVNVSVRKIGAELGTRVEIKNVNSIRFLAMAIEYESQRQINILEKGGQIEQSTRLFDPSSGCTKLMRRKEDAEDYRYFPEPDLSPLVLTDERIAAIASQLPELPATKVSRYMKDYGLNEADAENIALERENYIYFEACDPLCNSNPALMKQIANWMLSELFAFINKHNERIENSRVSPQALCELVSLIQDNVISGKIAKDVFERTWNREGTPAEIVEKYGLRQVLDSSVIASTVAEVLLENQSFVEEYKAGKEKLFGFFVGQIMKKTQGKLNPQMVNEELQKQLNSN